MDNENSKRSGTLRITRDCQFLESAVPYRVLIDDAEVGKVKIGRLKTPSMRANTQCNSSAAVWANRRGAMCLVFLCRRYRSEWYAELRARCAVVCLLSSCSEWEGGP
jgi:hypothetical protein